MERPDLGTDDRFALPRARLDNRQALTAEIEGWMAGFDSDRAVLDRLEAHRVPCAPVLDPAQAAGEPFFVERGAVRQVTDPLVGTIDVPGFPIKFSDAPGETDLQVHNLGQDNHSVLTGLLGYDEERIVELEDEGILVSKQH